MQNYGEIYKSTDGGRNWTESKQVIDRREGYDATRWGPGLEHGRNGGVADLLGPLPEIGAIKLVIVEQ